MSCLTKSGLAGNLRFGEMWKEESVHFSNSGIKWLNCCIFNDMFAELNNPLPVEISVLIEGSYGTLKDLG